MEKALRRLDGVGDVKVDLANGRAVVSPAPGKGFDPRKIPKAVKDAGFTPAEVEITASGTLVRKNGHLGLDMLPASAALVLAGGAKEPELRKRNDLVRRRVRITGKLHPSHADKPPGMTVERFEELSGRADMVYGDRIRNPSSL